LSWRREKVIFRNRKVMAFSAQNAIFPNLKEYAFSGHHNNLDAISSVWRPEKAFSKLERNRFFC